MHSFRRVSGDSPEKWKRSKNNAMKIFGPTNTGTEGKTVKILDHFIGAESEKLEVQNDPSCYNLSVKMIKKRVEQREKTISNKNSIEEKLIFKT